MTIGRRLNRAAKTRFLRSHPAPERPPQGHVTVPDCLQHHWPTGFAPGEAMQQQAIQSMWNSGSLTFRQMDKGNDYDLAARTKANRDGFRCNTT